MIDNKELRIGNLVEFEGNGYTVEINALDTNSCYYNFSCQSSYKSMTPIPLTEEWLVKFGFEFNNFIFELNEHQTRTVDNGLSWIYWIDSRFITNVKHVHQLQNLYFALTNKELKIK